MPAPAPEPVFPNAGCPRAQSQLSKKAAGVVALAVACSRVLGLLRELVLAALFNKGATDIFYAAFRIPNLLRDLFAEGALSTAFITTFSQKIATEGEDSAWRLANKVATLTVVFMSGVTLLGILFSRQLVRMVASGFDPQQMAVAIPLTQIMFPFILLVSLAALAMGMLNARHVFGWPAMASSFFNLGSIIAGVGLGWLYDPRFGMPALTGLSLGTLVGGLLQLVVQFPPLRRVGFRLRPDFRWRDPGVRQILTLMGPAVIAASAVQVNVLINTNFASHLGKGPISWLNWAFRLMQLPLGMFGVTLATVTLPLISRFAVRREMDQIRATLGHGLRLAFLLTVPCAVGFIFFPEPIISLLFQRGRFSLDSTLQTAAALRYYALGLAGYACIKILAPAFYALGRRYLPMLVSFLSIAVNYGLNMLFTFRLGFGHRGLALSTSLVALLNFAILYVVMARLIGGLESRALLRTVGKLALASVPLALWCVGAQAFFFSDLGGMSFFSKLTGVLGAILAGGLLFLGSITFLRVEEVADLWQILRRKLGKMG